jgi:hypothetical protein
MRFAGSPLPPWRPGARIESTGFSESLKGAVPPAASMEAPRRASAPRSASPLPHVRARAREKSLKNFPPTARSDCMDQGPLASEQFGCSAGSMPARTSPNVSASTWNFQQVRSKVISRCTRIRSKHRSTLTTPMARVSLLNPQLSGRRFFTNRPTTRISRRSHQGCASAVRGT